MEYTLCLEKILFLKKNYRELLATAMVKENFLVSKSPDTSLILIFNSYVIPDLSEVLVNTSLYNNGSIIFRDSSIFNLKKQLTFYN